jgi:hypothetical protein
MPHWLILMIWMLGRVDTVEHGITECMKQHHHTASSDVSGPQEVHAQQGRHERIKHRVDRARVHTNTVERKVEP